MFVPPPPREGTEICIPSGIPQPPLLAGELRETASIVQAGHRPQPLPLGLQARPRLEQQGPLDGDGPPVPRVLGHGLGKEGLPTGWSTALSRK